MAPRPENIDGQRFGRLMVLSEMERDRSTTNRVRRFILKCDCGQHTIGRMDVLRRGDLRSCGCLKREVCTAILRSYRRTRHGDNRKGKTAPEYICWRGMIQRCEYPPFNDYKYYGGRGVKVCERWRNSYENFLADMGRKPSPKHSIDRIDPSGNYEPGNCRWATASEQRLNRRDATT